MVSNLWLYTTRLKVKVKWNATFWCSLASLFITPVLWSHKLAIWQFLTRPVDSCLPKRPWNVQAHSFCKQRLCSLIYDCTHTHTQSGEKKRYIICVCWLVVIHSSFLITEADYLAAGTQWWCDTGISPYRHAPTISKLNIINHSKQCTFSGQVYIKIIYLWMMLKICSLSLLTKGLQFH